MLQHIKDRFVIWIYEKCVSPYINTYDNAKSFFSEIHIFANWFADEAFSEEFHRIHEYEKRFFAFDDIDHERKEEFPIAFWFIPLWLVKIFVSKQLRIDMQELHTLIKESPQHIDTFIAELEKNAPKIAKMKLSQTYRECNNEMIVAYGYLLKSCAHTCPDRKEQICKCLRRFREYAETDFAKSRLDWLFETS